MFHICPTKRKVLDSQVSFIKNRIFLPAPPVYRLCQKKSACPSHHPHKISLFPPLKNKFLPCKDAAAPIFTVQIRQ